MQFNHPYRFKYANSADHCTTKTMFIVASVFYFKESTFLFT